MFSIELHGKFLCT